MKLILSILMALMLTNAIASENYNGRYGWPVQKAPRKVIVCHSNQLSAAEMMLLESLSGLAAQAVNRDVFDEMVWIETDSPSYQQILESSLKQLNIKQLTYMNVWELLDYLRKKKIVKGYIAYQADKSTGDLYSRRKGINCSSNVATVYASLLQGVLADESLLGRMKQQGIRQLKDVRGETLQQCFEKNKKHLNNSSAASIDPQVTNCRDIAIAQKLMVYYDTNALSSRILEWVTPLSPILGWNCGDEDEYTGEITRWGHYNTASNWCRNLPLIMAASSQTPLLRTNEIEATEIDWNTHTSAHSFVMSDGDNMQWTMGNFLDTPVYYGNKNEERTPLSWTLCPINLSVVSASTWNRLVATKEKQASFVEYGGGYQYPDEFAQKRPNRTELLKQFAQRINWHFKKLNLKLFGFICKDVFSEASRQAFEIYAREIEGLTGMLAVQYDPYNMGGEIIWVKNTQGIEIPVVTAKYSIWADLFNLPTRGAPDYIASSINRDAAKAAATGGTDLSWTIIHAWSGFDTTVASTDLPQKGYNVARQADKMLSPLVRNISLNELLWRIRAMYKPEQIKNIVNKK